MCHGVRCLTMAFKIVSNFRIQAVERHLRCLACAAQTLIEGLKHRIVPHGHQGAHIQRGAHVGPAAPHRALASQGAAIPIEGRDADQRGDLLPTQGP